MRIHPEDNGEAREGSLFLGRPSSPQVSRSNHVSSRKQRKQLGNVFFFSFLRTFYEENADFCCIL